MYESFFGLNDRPFAALPRPNLYFAATAIENARTTLLRCLARGEGPAMVVGPAGTGKSLLCQMVADHFRGQFRVAMLSRAWLNTRRALLQAILFELNQPYRGMDEGELRLALIDYATNDEDCPRGILLLVDEAHHLPVRLLDEARMLTNLAVGGQPRVRLVLCGGPALEERLSSPKLESFSQRLIARCYLESLNRTETTGYIHGQLAAVGGNGGEVFPADACQSVHRATDGVPRLINQVCDHALLLAFAAGRKSVGPACVEEAWADLQQLPTPWNAADAPARGPSVVEFGGLDDDEPSADAPAEATLPMLRISPTDDADPEALAPLETLDAAMDNLEEEFQPAGTIGPEVELRLAASSDPFDELFEEEEVVVDRYAAAEPARPQAPRDEPDQPAADDCLAAWTVQSGLPATGMPAASFDTFSADPWVAAIVSAATLAADCGAGLADCQPPSEPAATTPADDRDLIVIEDGYDDAVQSGQPGPSPGVRRQDLRRLFAKLRG